MPKCKDCEKHEDARNWCGELRAPLAFAPDTEVVCQKFEPKEQHVEEGREE